MKVLDGIFKVTTPDAYTYWILPETLKMISEKEAQVIQKEYSDMKYSYNRGRYFWKDWNKYKESEKWIRLASGKTAEESKELITIEKDTVKPSVASVYAVNYAVIDSANYQAFVLEGNLRRYLLQILPNSVVRRLDQEKEYIQGELLRPYREKGRLPDTRWAIISSQPYAVYVFHRSEMDKKTARLLLSQVSLEDGHDIWTIDLSKQYELTDDDYPNYNWLYKNTLICLFKGNKRNHLLCFNIKDGSLKWKIVF